MFLPDARVIVVALVTFTIVMTGMIVLALAASLLRRVGTRLAGPAPVVPGAADPALLAVITAAASEAIGQPVAVHTLRVHRAPEIERWSRAGRMDVMVSHRVGPRR
jgi:hypothetical protein